MKNSFWNFEIYFLNSKIKIRKFSSKLKNSNKNSEIFFQNSKWKRERSTLSPHQVSWYRDVWLFTADFSLFFVSSYDIRASVRQPYNKYSSQASLRSSTLPPHNNSDSSLMKRTGVWFKRWIRLYNSVQFNDKRKFHRAVDFWHAKFALLLRCLC